MSKFLFRTDFIGIDIPKENGGLIQITNLEDGTSYTLDILKSHPLLDINMN